MTTVVNTVKEILSEDGLIIEALQRGVLNISAYAKEIHPQVEAKTKKQIQIGTIVVALSRLAESFEPKVELHPYIKIESLSLTTSLCSISYDKKNSITNELSQINHSYFDNANVFFVMTSGKSEITIICSKDIKHRITQSISQRPKAEIDQLSAISLRLSDQYQYMNIPNTIYSLTGIFAAKHINVMEVISTYTEVTLVVHEDELEDAIQALQSYQKRHA